MMSDNTSDNQQNAKLTEARQVVKKQLLKKLMQEAVDEIGSSDEAALRQLVGSVKSEIDFSELQSRIKPLLKGELEKDLMQGLSEVEEKLSGQLKGILSRRALEKASDSIDPEFLSRVSDRALEDHHGRLADQVESDLAVRIDRTAHEQIRKLLSEKRDDLHQRILGSIREETLDEIRSNVEASIADTISGKIDDSVREQISEQISKRALEHANNLADDELVTRAADDAMDRIRTDIAGRIESNIDTEIRSLASETLTSFMDRDDEELRPLFQGALDNEFLATTGKRALAAYSDEINTAVRKSVSAEMDSRIRGAVRELLSLDGEEFRSRISDSLDDAELDAVMDRVKATVTNGLAQQIQENGLDDIQKSLNEEVSMLVGRRAMEHVRKTIDQEYLESTGDTAFDELRDEIAERMRRRLDSIAAEESRKAVEEESFVADVSSAVRQDEDLLENTLDRVREMIVEHVASVSISRMDDVESVAQAARDHVSFDNDTMIAAMAMLRTRIMQDIARRTTKSLGETENVTEDALEWVNEEDPHIEEAASHVHRLALDTVRALAGKKISDTGQMAARVASEFDAESEPVQSAVEETRTRILERIEELAAERIANTDVTALEASSKIEDDHESIQKAVSAAVSMLMDDVVRLTEWRLSWTEKVAAEARGRMDDEPADVSRAAEELERMLVGEVADSAMARIADSESTAGEAGRLIERDNEIILRAVERLRKELIGNVAREAIESLSDADGVAGEAHGSIDPAHTHITSAIQRLRILLLGEVADGAIERIENAEKTASDSRRLIGPDQEAIQDSEARLYEMLLQEIGRSVLKQFSHVENAAEEALGRIDSEEETLVRTRTVLRRRLVERLLADALSTLGDEVSSESDDSERAFFRTALRQVMGREDDNGEDGGVSHRFRDRGPTPPKSPVPGHQTRKKETARSDQRGPKGAGSQVSGKPAFRIQENDDMNGTSEPNAHGSIGPMITEPGWTILSDIEEPNEDGKAGVGMASSQAERSWSVTEFKSAEDGPSSGDGIVADVHGDPDISVYGKATDEYTYRMSVRSEQLKAGIRKREGDLADILGEFHPAARVDGYSIEASADALLEYASNVLMLRLRTAGRPGKTENRGLGRDWMAEDEIVVATGSMYVAAEMEDAFRSAARAASEEFEEFGINVHVEPGSDS